MGFGLSRALKFGVIGGSIALISFSLGACGRPKRTTGPGLQSGIIGGELVPANDPVALMTAMLVDTDKNTLCTASVLNSDWLLTAGHCVADSDTESLVVAFSGSYQDLFAGKTPKNDTRYVQKAFVHPKYAATMKALSDLVAQAKASGKPLDPHALDGVKDWGDIALIRLSGKVPRGKKAFQFLPATQSIVAKESVLLAGYGQVTIDKDSPWGVLRDVYVNVVDPAWGGTEVLIDNHTKGACHGDSGGPAYANLNGQLYLFGITSRGVGDNLQAQCLHFTAFTNATLYTAWIASIVSAAPAGSSSELSSNE